MGSEQALGIPFSPDSSCDWDDKIVIEQEDWGKRGFTSKADIADFILRLFTTATTDTRKSGHGVEEDEDEDSIFTYTATIFVFIQHPSLSYRFGISYGEVVEDSFEAEEVTITEYLTSELDTELDLKYPVYDFGSISWHGPAYDNNGNIIAEVPAITIVDDKIKLSALAYGALKVVYTTIRHKRDIKIVERKNAPNNIFQSFAYALTSCSTDCIEIEPIPSVRDLENGLVGGSTGSVEWPDEKTPKGSGQDYGLTIDYCTGEIVSDNRPGWLK